MSDVINAHDLGVAGGYIIEAAMQGDIDKLKAENDKLRKDNDRLIQAIEDLHDVSLEDKLVQLENSNDKLRELVRDMLRYYAMPNEIDYRREADLLERAHEMGVEVAQ